MLKLLAITPLLGRSGSEIALVNLLGSLSTRFEITVYTPITNPDLKPELPASVKLVTPQKNNKLGSNFGKIFQKLRIYPPLNELDRWIGNEKFDIILLNTILSFKYYPDLRKKGKKIILYIHETESMLGGLNSLFIKEVLDDADLVLCSSKYVKSYLELFGRKLKIKVLYPSLDFSKFHLPIGTKEIRELLGVRQNEFVWGMCGATTVNKNPKMFIEAAKRILKKSDKTKFFWIGARGNDAYEEYLKKEVEAAGLKEKIKFIKKQTTDYYQYINALDGFVLTSLSESFSLAALEAASFNKPVVSFPCGGVREAVPDNLRWVTREFSIEELVGRMEMIMNKPVDSIALEDVEFLLQKDKAFAGVKFEKHLQDLSF